MIELIELVIRPDTTIGLGNSIEVASEAEAVELVLAGKAKFPELPIGVVPGAANKNKNQKLSVEDAE